jgi:hypothetical protein
VQLELQKYSEFPKGPYFKTFVTESYFPNHTDYLA